MKQIVLVMLLTLALISAGCETTAPAQPLAEENTQEVVEAKGSSTPLWLGLAALTVAIIALSDSDSDSGGQNCHWIVRGDGTSVQVCD